MTPVVGTGWVDLVLVLLVVLGAVGGWRRGGLRLAGSVVGLVVGLAVGTAVVPALTGSLQAGTRVAATVLGVLVVAALGSGLGRAAGGLLAGLVARLHLGVLDRLAGAVGGAVLALVVLGLGLALLADGPAGVVGGAGAWLTAARDSQVGGWAADAADQALRVVRGQTPDLHLPTGGPG
ncbi:CvpA family protein [Klenkia sp. PcliD-1-E]|uniref:CvpA family protein n=1 Tax=Klenkia sp. PcliD-1-E TaxID=2954492 RepID=UPI0020985BF5|nr:CvpA family protein [Klenkia sp. PcliD-1-E]MCO7219194.1 CvpA family protein [Klenkia sp. PcliD-1-E]